MKRGRRRSEDCDDPAKGIIAERVFNPRLARRDGRAAWDAPVGVNSWGCARWGKSRLANLGGTEVGGGLGFGSTRIGEASREENESSNSPLSSANLSRDSDKIGEAFDPRAGTFNGLSDG